MKNVNDPALEWDDLVTVPASDVRGLFWPSDAVAEVCLTQEEMDVLNAYQLRKVQAKMEHRAFQKVAIAHSMSGDIRVIKAEVTDFVVGDAA